MAEVAVEVDGRWLGRSSAPTRPRGGHPLNLPETRAGLEESDEGGWVCSDVLVDGAVEVEVEVEGGLVAEGDAQPRPTKLRPGTAARRPPSHL